MTGRACLCLALLLAGARAAAAQEPSTAADTAGAAADVRAVVAGFHAALADADSLRALEYLHPQASIFESGHAEAVADYRSGHLAADIAFATAVRRTVEKEDATVLAGAALYTAVTRTTGRWRGRDIDSRGTETMVLIDTPDGWRIRHIHWSSR